MKASFKKNWIRALFALLLLALLAAAGYVFWVGQHESASLKKADNFNSSTNAVTEKKPPLYWHDPMVPGPKFDKPGKSPFMDMQLVPVYADNNAADSGVTINPRAQQNLGVRTVDVVRGKLTPTVSTVGSIGWNEREVALVSARAAGYVEKLFVRAAFDPVRKGQPLAELYVPDWIAAQEDFLALQRSPSMDVALLDAARQRMRLVGMTDVQIANVAARRTLHARVTIVAPIDGVLAEIAVREGSTVALGAPLARINGLSSVWANAELPEAQATQVAVGSRVEVSRAGGATVIGRVNALLPDINPTTRTLKIRIELPNRNRALVPGMFVNLRFQADGRDDVLLIPAEALIATGNRNLVMLAQDNGGFTPVEVVPGLEANGQIEIKKGLQAGQRVVQSGQFLIDSDASLKGIAARPTPAAKVDGGKP